MHMLANAIAVCSSVFSLDLTSSFTAVRANDYYWNCIGSWAM